ncbi:MAG: hypothetical protein ACRD1T_23570, partial [Acidimicrobiia bacterium]
FELIPAPTRLYSAAIPSIYQTIAADPRDVSVLQLPFGVKDGTYETGRFNTASQYYQTYHRKRLIGGYLSRISHHRIKAYHRRPTLFTLLMLSQGREVEPFRVEAVIRRGRSFVERAKLGYVVIDRAHATPALVHFATEAFELEKIAESDGRELYRTRLQ